MENAMNYVVAFILGTWFGFGIAAILSAGKDN